MTDYSEEKIWEILVEKRNGNIRNLDQQLEALFFIFDVKSLVVCYKEYPQIRVLGELSLIYEFGDIIVNHASEKDFDFLVGLLKDQDWHLRTFAIEALQKIGDVKAVESLIEILGDDIPNVSIKSASALGQLQDSKAVEPLIQLATGKTKNKCWSKPNAVLVRVYAIEALIRFNDERILSVLDWVQKHDKGIGRYGIRVALIARHHIERLKEEN